MKVVEIFYSIDGEGKRAGELTTFIRLFGCNLRCSYCDTKYSYESQPDKLPYKEMSITQIIEECKKYRTKNITVTGGEPLIHDDIEYLLQGLSQEHFDVNVETNGSVNVLKYLDDKKYENVWFTIDYKCLSSEMNNRMCMDNFTSDKNYLDNIVYKFVVGDNRDLIQAYEIICEKLLKTTSKTCYIYLSPVYGKIEPSEIVEFMKNCGLYSSNIPIRVQLQLHKYIWDVNKRGV